VKNIKDKGVTVVALDFDAGQEAIIKAFTGQDVVISCVVPSAGNLEKDLASAAKAAGVKRFVPSFWASVTPPAGVLRLREFVSLLAVCGGQNT
jgi:hypothetical protein